MTNLYGDYAERYREHGFMCPIPIPPKKKNPPPTGFTGHLGEKVDDIQLRTWINTKPDFNIGLRLWTVGEHDMVAIDVDHHPDDPNDPKNGGSQLVTLEKRFGKLPDTWISSAGDNGIHGHRFFLVPSGLEWRGDCGKQGEHIDIISKNYRFSVVFPSIHPNGKRYYWYSPGMAPEGQSSLTIPKAQNLTELPPRWVYFLTDGRRKSYGHPQDMSSTAVQLERWAESSFVPKDDMCPVMEKALAKWLEKLENSSESHPVLTKAHYNLFLMGSKEGHKGWDTACRTFEKAYISDVLERGKRTVDTVRNEIERSRTGALRRIKGLVDVQEDYTS